MANTLRVKRRWTGNPGAPASLKSGELAFNGVDHTFYIGYGDDGSGIATSIEPFAGKGSFVTVASDQSLSGIKTFSASPLVPTAIAGDNSTKAASTAFVAAAIASITIADGDKGDITVASSGASWTIDPGAVTLSKMANAPAGTLIGNNGGAAATPLYLTSGQVKTMLALTQGDVGLSLVNNTADADKPISTAQQAALDGKVDKTALGAANGVATLDGTGKVPSAQLPSFVDDVIEAGTYSALPVTGASGVIYVTADDNKTYRWSGSTYVEISASPGSTDSVTEGSINLYFTNVRAQNAVVVQTLVAGDTSHAPSADAVKAALDLKADASALTSKANTADVLAKANNLSDLSDASLARNNLGVGSMGTQNANAVAITGGSIDGVTLDGGTF